MMLIDLLHLARNLRRSPASAAAAVLTLALTLGAGASTFAIVKTVLTPPPFANPEALVLLGERPGEQPAAPGRPVSYATFAAWRERAQSLAALEAIDGTNVTLTELGAPERLSVNDVTPGFLSLLGVTPMLGRGFDANDIGSPVAIVSHAFWRERLAADRNVIGRQLVLGGLSHTIVGVLPERFVFEINPSAVWRPLPLTPAQAARAGYRMSVLARLAPNVPSAVLTAALDDVSRTSSPPAEVASVPLMAAISGDATRMLGLLAGAAALAILIAFTNFAGLLIVRAIDRRRELAVRSALGASASEVARQLLLEAQALVALGTAGGAVLATWIAPAAARLVLEQYGGVAHRQVAVSWPVIAGMAVAASACACVCALVPAIVAARRDILDVLRRGATPPPRETVLRRAFVIGQVALAFVLLACVTLLGGSLLRLLETDPGFDPRGVLAMQVALPPEGYDDARVAWFYSTLQTSLEERLGPRSTAIVSEIPLDGSLRRSLVSTRPGDAGFEAVVREASPAYFDVMRIPLVAGRPFEWRDTASAPPRVVISASLAEELFGSGPPIGHHVWLAPGAQAAEVIGVVGDVTHRALDEPVTATVYLSTLQSPSRSSIVVVRGRSGNAGKGSVRPDADAVAAVREEVARLDGRVPVYRVRSMEEVVAASPGMPARRVLTATFAGFAFLALALGAIGLFGAIAHDVASRRAELAIRIAVGAHPMRIVGAVARQGAVMVGSGLAVGGVLSVWAARVLGSGGFTSGRLDLLSVGVPAAMLLLAGVVAVFPAARRAARTDPLMALRSE